MCFTNYICDNFDSWSFDSLYHDGLFGFKCIRHERHEQPKREEATGRKSSILRTNKRVLPCDTQF